MKPSKAIVPVLLAALWMSANEFLRNDVLLKSFWEDHFASLGLVFPNGLANGAVWGGWALAFSVAAYVIARRFNFYETTAITWFMGYFLMWLTIGNLNVLPYNLLFVAIPWSLLEVYGAVWIIKRFDRQTDRMAAA